MGDDDCLVMRLFSFTNGRLQLLALYLLLLAFDDDKSLQPTLLCDTLTLRALLLKRSRELLEESLWGGRT